MGAVALAEGATAVTGAAAAVAGVGIALVAVLVGGGIYLVFRNKKAVAVARQ